MEQGNLVPLLPDTTKPRLIRSSRLIFAARIQRPAHPRKIVVRLTRHHPHGGNGRKTKKGPGETRPCPTTWWESRGNGTGHRNAAIRRRNNLRRCRTVGAPSGEHGITLKNVLLPYHMCVRLWKKTGRKRGPRLPPRSPSNQTVAPKINGRHDPRPPATRIHVMAEPHETRRAKSGINLHLFCRDASRTPSRHVQKASPTMPRAVDARVQHPRRGIEQHRACPNRYSGPRSKSAQYSTGTDTETPGTGAAPTLLL